MLTAVHRGVRSRIHLAMTNRLVVVLALVACGGANLNRRSAGNAEGGIFVEHGEIAVEEQGRWVIVRNGARLLVGDVASLALTELPLRDVALLAFWTRGLGVYAVTRGDLVSYDLVARREVWRRPLGEQVAGLDATADRVIVSDAVRRPAPTEVARMTVIAPHGISLFDAATGAPVSRFTADGPIDDLDLTPDGARAILTRREVWSNDRPETAIHVLSTATGERLCTARVPNCADELIVHPDGERAYLAPTHCRRDPVSIVNITASCAFEVNLPGFGPIALTPDGSTGIAFLDRQANDPTAPPRPAEVDRSRERFHLMMFDTKTLALRTVPVGDTMPRYAMTPDGKELVVDGITGVREAKSFAAAPVRIVTVEDGAIRTATGPAVTLDAYVTAPGEIWLLHGRERTRALYRLDLVAGAIEHVALPFEPRAINALPDNSTLVLRDATTVHLFDRASRTLAAFHE
jgi:hypothetical protein